jgi:hypothetical protein
MNIEGCNAQGKKLSMRVNGESLQGSLEDGYTAPATLHLNHEQWDANIAFKAIGLEWIEGTLKVAPKGPSVEFRVCSWAHAPHRTGFSDIVVEPD